MRLIDADAVKEALRNRIGENIDECINNAPTVDVLDKIRADIEQMDFDFGDFYDHTETIREMVLKVIDKYKTESEDKE